MINKFFRWLGYEPILPTVKEAVESEEENYPPDDVACSIEFILLQDGVLDVKIFYEREKIKEFSTMLFELNTGLYYTQTMKMIQEIAAESEFPEDFEQFVEATQAIVAKIAQEDEDDEDLVSPLDVIKSHKEDQDGSLS